MARAPAHLPPPHTPAEAEPYSPTQHLPAAAGPAAELSVEALLAMFQQDEERTIPEQRQGSLSFALRACKATGASAADAGAHLARGARTAAGATRDSALNAAEDFRRLEYMVQQVWTRLRREQEHPGSYARTYVPLPLPHPPLRRRPRSPAGTSRCRRSPRADARAGSPYSRDRTSRHYPREASPTFSPTRRQPPPLGSETEYPPLADPVL